MSACGRKKSSLAAEYHDVKHIKNMPVRRCPLHRGAIRGYFFYDERVQRFDPVNGRLKPVDINAQSVVALCAFYAPARVMQLAIYHVARDAAALPGVVRDAVLHTPEENVAGGLADTAGEEAPARCAEAQGNISLRARAHERGDAPEYENEMIPDRGVKREARELLPVPIDDHIFTVETEVCVLGSDKKSVEQLFHGASSILPRR